ncbi:MAG: hypothetical protein H6772_02545 [Pseudomonadales bacterium]|nr:hypothetical protein [Pseudomonadales bacterium]
MTHNLKKIVLALVFTTLWISFSEFLRNELLFKSYWINHFESLGLIFKTLVINGFLWVIWSFCLAFLILKLLQKFSFKETIFLSWIPAFLMMWITMYNLQVLPFTLLLFAIPLSLLEIYISGIIIKYFIRLKK